MNEQEPTDEQTTVNIDAMAQAIKHVMQGSAYNEIMRLRGKVEAQRSEIKNLTGIATGKVARSQRDMLAMERAKAGLLTTKEGDVLIDGFGKECQVASVGPNGFMDDAGKAHYWAHGYFLKQPVGTSGA